MMPLKMVEAIVDLTAAKCATFAGTGTNTSEVYTPHAVKTFDQERALSNGCVFPLSHLFLFFLLVLGCDPSAILPHP